MSAAREAMAARPGRWSDAATWVGDGLRRKVFMFGPGEPALYGSLYAAAERSRPHGVVVCASWGFEAHRTDRLAHGLAAAMGRLGGAGLVFHYPGYGDSGGAAEDMSLEAMAAAAATALEEAGRRCPDTSWTLTGLMLGAAVAAVAGRATASRRLMLIQPSLRPSRYFERVAKKVTRTQLSSGAVADRAFAYPLPRRIVDSADAADAEVDSALARFRGDGAVVRYAKPAPDRPAPEGLEEIVVDGAWHFADKEHGPLKGAAIEWLDRATRDPEAPPARGAAA